MCLKQDRHLGLCGPRNLLYLAVLFVPSSQGGTFYHIIFIICTDYY